MNGLLRAEIANNPLAPKKATSARARNAASSSTWPAGRRTSTPSTRSRNSPGATESCSRTTTRLLSNMARGERRYVGSPFDFRQAGESGLWMCDRWKHLPSVADDLCIYRGCQGESVNTPDRQPAHEHRQPLRRRPRASARGSATGSAPRTPTCRASSSSPVPTTRRVDPPTGPTVTCPRTTRARRCARRARRSSTSIRRRVCRDRSSGRTSTCLPNLRNSTRQLTRSTNRSPRACTTTSSCSACRPRYRACSTSMARTRGPRRCTASAKRRPTRSAGAVCWRGGWSRKACASCRPTLSAGIRMTICATPTPRASTPLDKPMTGLIQDLKQRDLLKDTLIVWCGEFGRSPDNQAKRGEAGAGRDHNPEGHGGDVRRRWRQGGQLRRRHRRDRPQGGRGRPPRSGTCTPRFFTCWG